jgi:UDP-N-acetylglucosamine 2-epimerase (non-hydrolysing)
MLEFDRKRAAMVKTKLKVITVCGTRPEVIKLAPVIKELFKRRDRISCKVCVTAQHRHMIDPLLKLFDIKPDYDLNIMKKNQTLGHITNSILKLTDEVIEKERPDYLLVQGDTTTAMAASLAAFYRKTKVGHVEAGLRTWNKAHPYPEEVNRKIIDSLSDLYFAHTEGAKRNLLKEGIKETDIEVTGNTVIDSLLDTVNKKCDLCTAIGKKMGLNGRKIILVTAHRRESFGDPLRNICEAIKTIALKYQDHVDIVYPVHLNPNVKVPVMKILNGVENVHLLDPLEYLPFVHLMKHSHFILTDSGGIQEEAPSLGKPVLVMRKVTERPEAVKEGVVKIIGIEAKDIIRQSSRLMEDERIYKKMARGINPYGDGKAGNRIVSRLLK